MSSITVGCSSSPRVSRRPRASDHRICEAIGDHAWREGARPGTEEVALLAGRAFEQSPLHRPNPQAEHELETAEASIGPRLRAIHSITHVHAAEMRNDAFIQSFEITYTGASLPPWTVLSAITVPSAGSAGALLPLIPFQSFASISPPSGSTRTRIVASVRAHGVLASQISFTTPWFQVPVEVCAGCLAGSFCPPGSVAATCPSMAPGQSASFTCIGATARE